ncbi:unnamed protein product [Paramecium primaurelia]|uniref:Uncharacterized protein n=2 Tax=Paramecium TaxID=5884 RepID=A0A8S1VEE7_9CILI|nr:unnamed protein product [Paramecium primaurelia]CAD8173226.1 unnamed protein product [Paramecium pentaurelia]
MKFSFLKHNLQSLLNHSEQLDSPTSIIKKFGPFLMSSLFNQQLEESKQVIKYMEQNIDQAQFIRNFSYEPGIKNWRINLKKSLEGLACSLIVGNPNLINKHYVECLYESQIPIYDAIPLAYTLVIQQIKKWPLVEEKEVLSRLNYFLQTQKQEFQKIGPHIFQMKLLLSDLGIYYPDVANFLKGKVFNSDLPLDYFASDLRIQYQDFFFEDGNLIDLKIGDQVYLFLQSEDFENQTMRTFLQRYVRIKRISELYPNLHVVWIHNDLKKDQLYKVIGV